MDPVLDGFKCLFSVSFPCKRRPFYCIAASLTEYFTRNAPCQPMRKQCLTEAARARGLRAREARDFLHDAAQARLPTNDGSYTSFCC